MDVLSDVLRSMHVTASIYFCDCLNAPWSRTFSDAGQANFHMIRRGQCWLTTEDCTERLGPGDFVFTEPGYEHSLSSARPDDTADVESAETLLLCGYCHFETPLTHPLLKSLPSLTIVRSEQLHELAWLRSTLDQLSSEYLSQKPGSEVVVDKLTEALFVELIRNNFGLYAGHTFMAALHDKSVGRALELLHANTQQAWTIDALARNVGLSRAAFAKRFRSLVGQTVFEYLTHLRMQRAKELLRRPDLRLHEVAAQVGYESDLAFTRAFKRVYELTPTRFRKSISLSSDSELPS